VDSPAPIKATKINRWLPYWAVFQADLRQTLQSWVYRVWILVSVLAAAGYLLYRIGIQHEAGMIQSASTLVSDLLRWSALGSVTLVIALTGGSISSERGTMADSVLSRGISRYQYFLGKWHARLVSVLSTFLAMGLVALVGGHFFLEGDLSLWGSAIALATLVAFLAAVTTCGVTVSAVVNSTMLGITVVWILVHAVGFGLNLLPSRFLSPERVLNGLPGILRGVYNLEALGRLIGWSALGSTVVACLGLAVFGRRDV
jgi:hypothetical protein